MSLFDKRQYGTALVGSAIPGPKLLSYVHDGLGRHNSFEHRTFYKIETAPWLCLCQACSHDLG